MENRTKIRLLQHWLDHPEDMGDIPRELEKIVTSHDLLTLKKEIKWKPFTRKSVASMLRKAKVLEMGLSRGGRKGDPRIGLLFLLIVIFPYLFNLFFRGFIDIGSILPLFTGIAFMVAIAVFIIRKGNL